MRQQPILPLTVAALLAFGSVGCHTTAPAKATPPALHVKAVYPDRKADVVATYAGKEYELSVDRTDVPLYVAYWEPIGTQDVGRDFPAAFDKDRGQFVVQGTSKGEARYSVEAARETSGVR